MGIHVFNDIDPRFETVRNLRPRMIDIFPEELFRIHRRLIELLETPAFTTGAAVFVGAVMDLSFGNKNLKKLETLVGLETYRNPRIRLSRAVPLVSEWLGTR